MKNEAKTLPFILKEPLKVVSGLFMREEFRSSLKIKLGNLHPDGWEFTDVIKLPFGNGWCAKITLAKLMFYIIIRLPSGDSISFQ